MHGTSHEHSAPDRMLFLSGSGWENRRHSGRLAKALGSKNLGPREYLSIRLIAECFRLRTTSGPTLPNQSHTAIDLESLAGAEGLANQERVDSCIVRVPFPRIVSAPNDRIQIQSDGQRKCLPPK